MRSYALAGAWIAVLTLILGAPAVVAETPVDQPVLSEEPSVEEEPSKADLPLLDIFEPESRNLQPCTKSDGTSGAYYCTGEPCSNGLQCAQCCSGFGTDCGPVECVEKCFQL